MKTVIEMAREAGMAVIDDQYSLLPFLERFAELVRADEREKYKWDVHSCGPTCKRYACVALREAVEAEREACSGKVEVFARKWWSIHCDTNKHRDTTRKAHDDFCMLQAMIRARSNT